VVSTVAVLETCRTAIVTKCGVTPRGLRTTQKLRDFDALTSNFMQFAVVYAQNQLTIGRFGLADLAC